MVEIKRETTDAQTTQEEDGAKFRLIYAKSKVYVNPTAYARDNIPGFVAIVKRVRIPFSIPTVPLIRDVNTGGPYFDISSCLDPRKSSHREGSGRMG
jgi:hypothetical protein